MSTIAIIGASGFIGTRAVEVLYLNHIAKVRPVVRSYSSLSRLARFDLDCRMSAITDPISLELAFAGCDSVIHTAVGDARVMVDSVVATYQAAQRAGVKRIVYLSSTAVYGLAPLPGTDETSLLNSKQQFAYCKAKVIAEQRLVQLRQKGDVEIVILRPGIVYGPRSNNWTAGIANSLLNKQAYLVNNGEGICNLVYVDNVVDAICLALTADTSLVDAEAFLIVDDQVVTWFDLYQSIASSLGIDMNSVYRVCQAELDLVLKRTWRDTFNEVRAMPTVQRILPFVPGDLKTEIKKILFRQRKTSVEGNISGHPAAVIPSLMPEYVMAQLCQYMLPNAKAKEILGYNPSISFAEGSRRAVGWLAFSDYPVVS